MEILDAIGIAVAVVIIGLLFVAVAFFVWAAFRLRRLGKLLADAGGDDTPQFRVHLEPLIPFDWTHQEASELAVAQLAANHFAEAGRFTLSENPAARLVGLVNEEESLLAAVYELGPSGPHIDIVSEYEDGRHLTVTNVAPTGLDEQDDCVLVRDPQADAAALVVRARETQLESALVSTRVDDFKKTFERAYADEMDWRVRRGGFDRLEMTRAAHIQAAALDNDAVKVDDATVDLLLSRFNTALFYGVDEALRERLEATTTMPVGEWEQVRDRLVFIHDHLPTAMLRERIAACGLAAGGDDQTGEPARAVFAEALARAGDAPDAGRTRFLTTVDEPFVADVYALAAEPAAP